jgi:hypothetical protein
MAVPRRNQFAPHRVGVRKLSGLGAGPTTQQEVQAGSSVIGAASGAAIGAAAGSVIPGLGTAIGFAVGVIADSLIHVGQGPERAAQSAAIVSALASITTANHQGQAIPWNGTASAPGLQQFLQALMTQGIYMSWDPSLISSPAVNGNWATTFIAAVKAVVLAIVNNATGAALSVPIVLSTGASGVPTKNFTFNNPGISVGPDVIAANIIMGNGGLMYWIIISIGETTAHASANGNNASAQKVFALMVDHAAYDDTPVPPPTAAPLPVATPAATQTPSGALPTSAPPAGSSPAVVPASGAVQPVTQTGTTASGSPVVAPGDESALIQQLIAQGASQTAALNAALASMQANQIQPQPAQVAQLQAVAAATPSAGFLGLSTTTLLIIGAVGIGAIVLLKK